MLPELFHIVKAVYFDLDNTLIDRDAALRLALPGWLRVYVPELSQADYAAQIPVLLDKDNSGHTDRIVFCTWLKNTYSIAAMTPLDIANALASSIAQYISRDDAVIGFLATLQRSHQTGLISNGQGKTQRTKLTRAGLNDSFLPETIYIGGECGYEKPDRRIFERVVSDLGLAPGEILFVGDHPLNDVAGAHAAGMKTCWVSHGLRAASLPIQADMIVASIDEMFNLSSVCQA